MATRAAAGPGSGPDAEFVLTPADRGYPPALAAIPDPPGRLHLRGRLAREVWHDPGPLEPAIAVVGSRDASAYGLAVARDLGRELAARGVVVVSGLAMGIDGAAHRGALEAGGVTVAVVGAGTDVVYPRPHAALRQEILARGLVLGELEPGTPPGRGTFPRRNRIVSGLCLGVVVVEASFRSGSLITAGHALEQGREIFAVPGPVVSPRSRGPHALLKKGARLVENVEDIFAELPVLGAGLAGRRIAAEEDLPENSRRTLEWIRGGASTADRVAVGTGRQVAEILADLIDLELRGLVLRGPGGGFVAIGSTGGPPGPSGGGAI